MTDRKEDQEISPCILHAIEKSFGSIEGLKTRFVEEGLRHAGAGWLWLIKTEREQLKVVTLSEHETPLTDLVGERGTPLLVCDLREQSAFKGSEDPREESLRKFLRGFFASVNWSRVERLFKGQLH